MQGLLSAVRVGVPVIALLFVAVTIVWGLGSAWDALMYVVEGRFWNLMSPWMVNTWRMFNATLGVVALVLTLKRLWRYDGLWTFQEKNFLRGTALYALSSVVGSVEVLYRDSDAGWRILFVTIASCHVIYAGLRPPKRLTGAA